MTSRMRFCPSGRLTYEEVWEGSEPQIGDLVDDVEPKTFKVVAVHYVRDAPGDVPTRLVVAHSLDRVCPPTTKQ